MNSPKPVATDDVSTLAGGFSGQILCPGDEGYDAARKVHNGMIDRRPAIIARCQSTVDVVDALAFGRVRGLEIAVRGGGHNVAGRAVCEDGMMIDLSLMKGIWVDPKARRVQAQAGVCWGEFNRATQHFGLATTGGAVGSTGIAGLTLGGGFGYLMGKFGYTIDNLRAVELVTADGAVIQASESENPELFWGVRGGGGNFGVATSFEFELHPLGPVVHGGLIAFDFADTGASLRFLRQLSDAPDDEMTAVASLSHAPDGSGRKIAAMLVCHCGGDEDANRALASVRAVAEPVTDKLGPIAYSDLNRLLDPGFPKLAMNYWKSCFVEALSDQVIEILVSQFRNCPSSMSKLIIERPHGAALRRASDETAFPHRTAGYSILILSQWQASSDSSENMTWAKETYNRLLPHTISGAYSNYLGDDENLERVRQAFGANFERLQQLKDKYDPENVFHLNQNIPPSR